LALAWLSRRRIVTATPSSPARQAIIYVTTLPSAIFIDHRRSVHTPLFVFTGRNTSLATGWPLRCLLVFRHYRRLRYAFSALRQNCIFAIATITRWSLRHYAMPLVYLVIFSHSTTFTNIS